MGLIEDYKRVSAACRAMQGELTRFVTQRKTYQDEISRLDSDIKAAELRTSKQIDQMMQQRLAELTVIEQKALANKQQDIEQKINSLRDEADKQHVAISLNKYEAEFSEYYSTCEQVEEVVSTIQLPQHEMGELLHLMTSSLAVPKQYTLTQIKHLIKEVQGLSMDEDLDTFEESHIEKGLSFLSLNTLLDSHLSNRGKFWACMTYMLFIAAGFVFVPVVPTAMLSISTVLSLRSYSKKVTKMSSLALPYAKLLAGYQCLKKRLADLVETKRAEDLAAVDKQYQANVDPLTSQLVDCRYQQQTINERVQSKISGESLRKSVEEQAKAEREMLVKEKQANERKLKNVEAMYKINTEKIAMAKKTKEELLPQIRDLYLNPTEPGTSPFLIKSFLISIDEEKGKLDEFNYNGYSTFIMYKGRNSSANKPLITMMLMQFMASMSLASLDIYLTDTYSAGMDYAPFSLCVSIKSTESDIKHLLETINDKLIERRDSIAAKEVDIEAFNKKRIETHGLTVPYILLIMQDLTVKEMTDDKLIQIAVNGPRVGIVPIVFVNHVYINELHNVSEQDLLKLKKFFAAFRYSQDNKLVDNTFVFEGTSGDLKQNSSVINVIMNQIEGRI